MSNQNLPKLFFFNIEPWKEVYNDRFLLKQLQEKGFPIEYVWIGPLVGLLSNVPYTQILERNSADYKSRSQ